MVIDKDRKPDWRPDSLHIVTPEMVDGLLAPLDQPAFRWDHLNAES
jgi:hypothetical protein